MAGLEIDFIRMALTGLARRQEAIANNIANMETPGYERNTVNFERVLRQTLANQQSATGKLQLAANRSASGSQSAARHIPLRSGSSSGAGMGAQQLMGQQLSGMESVGTNAGPRNDGNTVDLDQEMTELATTQIQFAGLTAAMSAKLRTLRAIIENM